MLVVHVEDDLESQELIARFLRKSGCEIKTFNTAIDALNYVNHVEPDVLLADYRLGDGANGLMLAKHVREKYANCVIIMISQYPDFDKAVAALRIGVDDFLRKPITAAELNERLWEDILQHRKRFPQDIRTNVIPGVEFDSANFLVVLHGKRIKLTPTEYNIVTTLTAKPEQVFFFQDLYFRATGQYVSVEQARNLLKRHIHHLRRKLGYGWIINVRGQGYKWKSAAANDGQMAA